MADFCLIWESFTNSLFVYNKVVAESCYRDTEDLCFRFTHYLYYYQSYGREQQLVGDVSRDRSHLWSLYQSIIFTHAIRIAVNAALTHMPVLECLWSEICFYDTPSLTGYSSAYWLA